MAEEYRHTDGLFVSPKPGNTVHIFDEDREADGLKSDLYRMSLCGQSFAKVNNGKSLAANKSKVTCGNCLRFLDRCMTQETKNIDPDCTCPECGRPAEENGIVDMRDQGGKKFRQYNHKKSDSGLITEDWCAEVIEE